MGPFSQKVHVGSRQKRQWSKAEKAIAKKAHKAKKLTELVTMAKLGSTKKIPKGEREEIFGPFNPKSGERRALTKKESSKGEVSKNNVQVVEQLGSTSDSS